MKAQKMTTLAKSILIAGLLSAVTLPVSAQNHYNGQHHGVSHQTHTSYDYAKVVRVNPVYETVQVNHPVEQCYQEQVPVKQRSHRNRQSSSNSSYTNEVIGGVIGGVIGNQIGKRGRGKSRDVATVVGAVLGATVANSAERDSYRDSSRGHYQKARYQTVEHCELRDSYSTKQELIGYDVAYKYNGNVYHTKLDQHPGKKIKVQVAVRPV